MSYQQSSSNNYNQGHQRKKPFSENKSKDYIPFLKEEIKQSKILIAESELDILSLFNTYLASKGIRSDAVDRGDSALDVFMDKRNKGQCYQAIVLDTELKDLSGLDVAQKIRCEKPDQKVIMVTTKPKEQLPKDKLNSAKINKEDILVMPFKLSTFASALR